MGSASPGGPLFSPQGGPGTGCAVRCQDLRKSCDLEARDGSDLPWRPLGTAHGQALPSGRLTREAPTLTARGMASAVKGLDGVRRCPSQYDGAGLPDRMGVSPDRLRKRPTQKFSKALPRRPSQARSIIEKSDTHTLSSLRHSATSNYYVLVGYSTLRCIGLLETCLERFWRTGCREMSGDAFSRRSGGWSATASMVRGGWSFRASPLRVHQGRRRRTPSPFHRATTPMRCRRIRSQGTVFPQPVGGVQKLCRISASAHGTMSAVP